MNITLKLFVGKRMGDSTQLIKQKIASEISKTQKELFKRAKYDGAKILEKNLNRHMKHHHFEIVGKGRGRYLVEYYTTDPLLMYLLEGTRPHPESARGYRGATKFKNREESSMPRDYDIPKTYKSNFPKALTLQIAPDTIGWFQGHVWHKGAKPQQWMIVDLYAGYEELRNSL